MQMNVNVTGREQVFRPAVFDANLRYFFFRSQRTDAGVNSLNGIVAFDAHTIVRFALDIQF